MLIKNALATGAAVGAGIAAVMIALDHLRPFSIPVNDFIDRKIFRVCPLYALGFSSSIPNKAVWFLVTILGNAVLYGVAFLLIGLLWNLFSRRPINP